MIDRKGIYMVRIKKTIAILVGVAMLASLSGCTTYDNFKNAFFDGNKEAQERTIKIGIFEPMTGENKTEGEEEVQGIELAHELYPTACGKKVELVYGDNKSDIYTGETVIQELISSNSPSVILGSYGETLTLIAGKYAKANNIPAIAISSTNPLITTNNDYYFSASYSETRQGDAMADYAFNSQGKTTAVAVKFEDDDASTATIKRFSNRFKKLTGESSSFAGTVTVAKSASSYSETIEKIRNSGAETVFVALSAEKSIEFLKQAAEAGLTNVLYLGTKSWHDDELMAYVKNNRLIDTAFPTEESQNAETAMSDEFIKAYKEKYGEIAEPSERAAVAFDAYCMAIDAMNRAYENMQTMDPESLTEDAATDAEGRTAKEVLETALETGIPAGEYIRDALLETVDFQGASGVINYNGKNEASKTITITHFQFGTEQAVYTVQY